MNFIDTADVYNGGESEVVTGEAVKNDRDDWVVATKFGNPMGPAESGRSVAQVDHGHGRSRA